MPAPQPEAVGSFRQYPLPKLLFYLYRKQFTGVMVVSLGITERILYLRDGLPVMADIAEVVERSARRLLLRGWVSEETFGRTLAEALAAGAGHADHLLAMGAVTAPQLEEVRKDQLVDKLTHLFRFRDAEFALYRWSHEHGASSEEARRMRVHPRRVIYHGIRAIYGVERIRTEIGSALDRKVFRIGPDAIASLPRYRFSPDDGRLVQELSGSYASVESLLQAASDELDVWVVTYALLATAALQIRPAVEEPARPGGRRPVATPAPVVRATLELGRPTYRFSQNTAPPDPDGDRLSLPADLDPPGGSKPPRRHD